MKAGFPLSRERQPSKGTIIKRKANLGEQLIASLEEAVADARGKPAGVRKRIVYVPARAARKPARRSRGKSRA
ncbi:MAG TPA: hypothetical protein VIM38_01820 [Alphaproteobacteria bacterium]|jgi:hypothetical protein